MADRIEREIEEILAKFDDVPGTGRAREPISIADHRQKRPGDRKPPRQRSALRITPTQVLLWGAGAVVVGLVLSAFFEPLIWVSVAGTVAFIAGFIWSFRYRAPVGAASPGGGQKFWRDRYIDYEPRHPGVWDRLRGRRRR